MVSPRTLLRPGESHYIMMSQQDWVAGGKEIGVRWCRIYTSGYGRDTTQEMSFGTRQMLLMLENDSEVEDRRKKYCVNPINELCEAFGEFHYLYLDSRQHQ